MVVVADNGAVVVVARHYDKPEFNPVGQVGVRGVSEGFSAAAS